MADAAKKEDEKKFFERSLPVPCCTAIFYSLHCTDYIAAWDWQNKKKMNYEMLSLRLLLIFFATPIALSYMDRQPCRQKGYQWETRLTGHVHWQQKSECQGFFSFSFFLSNQLVVGAYRALGLTSRLTSRGRKTKPFSAFWCMLE
jgi:hypothetical protein